MKEPISIFILRTPKKDVNGLSVDCTVFGSATILFEVYEILCVGVPQKLTDAPGAQHLICRQYPYRKGENALALLAWKHKLLF